MKIVNEQGITIKGAVRFEYKGRKVVIDMLGEVPQVTVTINGTPESFTSMDDAIGRIEIDIFSWKYQTMLDSPN